MKSKENELAVMFPTGKTITVKGEELTLKPFKLGELPRVFKAIEPISAVLFNMLSDGSISQIQAITSLIGEGGDNILQLVSIGSRKPIEWVNDLDIDEGVELLTSVIEVNADFFIRKVLPKLNLKMEQVAKVGPTS